VPALADGMDLATGDELQWTRLNEDEAAFDLGFAGAVDAELFRPDSVMRWLDRANGRLKPAAAQPPLVLAHISGMTTESHKAPMSCVTTFHGVRSASALRRAPA